MSQNCRECHCWPSCRSLTTVSGLPVPCRCQCHRLADHAPQLLAACRSLISAANDAHDHWNADRDAKVGKLLAAMGGHLKGYRADLDAAHDAIAEAAP